MGKTVKLILIVILGFIIGYCMLAPSEELTPEEKIEEWLETSDAEVAIGDQTYPIDSAELSEGNTQVVLIDEEGQTIAILPVAEFLDLIDKSEPVVLPEDYLLAPEPVEVPVPTPPPANITNATPPTVPTPTTPAVCGNGIVEGTEECDDGNILNEDGCSSSCQDEFCGDFVVQTGLGEQCEPPNSTDCDANCQTITAAPTPSYPAHCSDGQWNGDESDLDCGGSCAPCQSYPAYASSCWTDGDCLSNDCAGESLLPIFYNNVTYNDYASIRALAGDSGIIKFQGQCQ